MKLGSSEAHYDTLMVKLPGLRRYEKQLKPEVSYTELAALAVIS